MNICRKMCCRYIYDQCADVFFLTRCPIDNMSIQSHYRLLSSADCCTRSTFELNMYDNTSHSWKITGNSVLFFFHIEQHKVLLF